MKHFRCNNTQYLRIKQTTNIEGGKARSQGFLEEIYLLFLDYNYRTSDAIVQTLFFCNKLVLVYMLVTFM